MAKTIVEKNENEKAFKMEYTGTAAETNVLGLGSFKRGEPRTFEDPLEIEQAEQVVKYNRNFKEVKA